MPRLARLFACIVLASVALIGGSFPASAQTCEVPDSHGTITAAVDDQACTEIAVRAGTWEETVFIDRDVAITGSGIGQTILKPSAGAVFEMFNQPTLTLEGLSLEGPETQGNLFGVGVAVDGTLVARDVSIQYFQTGIIAVGGSEFIQLNDCDIANNERGVDTEFRAAGFLMENCTVRFNSPRGGLSLARGRITNSRIEHNLSYRQGGGVFFGVSGTLDNTVVSNNQSGLPGEPYADGGGVFLLGKPNDVGAAGEPAFIIRDSVIENNVANRYGGGVAVHACNVPGCEGLPNYLANLLMERTIVRNNSVSDLGGGVSVRGYALIQDSTIERNGSLRDPTIYVDGFGDGGGVGIHVGEATIERTLIRQNGASNDGGGITVSIGSGGKLRLVNSTVTENNADGNGGAIFDRGQIEILNSTIAGNVADANSDGVGDGGGLALAGIAYPAILSSIISANEDRSPTQQMRNCMGGTVLSYGGNLFNRFGNNCSISLSANASPVPDQINQRAGLSRPIWDSDTYVVPFRRNGPAAGTGFCDKLPSLQVDEPLTVDQRGEKRDPAACDIGSYEQN
ncbi:MAG: hypothetical protein AAGC83_01290 [Pseudomonadota bacterium]